MNTLIIQSQLLELYPKHMETCYPMHTTEIPIVTSCISFSCRDLFCTIMIVYVIAIVSLVP